MYRSATYVTYKAYPIYSDNSVIAMRKGDTGYVVIVAFTNMLSLPKTLYSHQSNQN